MTNTCIFVSLYFDKNIGLSTPNLPTPQTQTMFPIVYHTELTGSYALNGSISLNMPSSVTAYPNIKQGRTIALFAKQMHSNRTIDSS